MDSMQRRWLMTRLFLGRLCAIAAVILAGGCNEHATYDASKQAGAEPPLPGAHNFLAPPIQVPKYVGWQSGKKPKVADGLQIEAIAAGWEHPRQVYGLPNGDILVAESNSPDAEPVT